MRVCLLLVLVVFLVAAARASPTGVAAPAEAKRSFGLRSLLIGCLDSQGEESEDESSGDFMSCLSSQLRSSGGELKIFPGLTLSAEDINMSGNGQRAISGHALKLALPWTDGNARFFGGWNNPSLVLSGGESELDIGVEMDKDVPGEEGTGRGKKLKKILIPLMIGLKLKSALFSMLSYGAVITMAAKALLLSIVAIAIAGIGAMRRMYKEYSDTTTMHAYSSYEPTPSYSAYHHRSYGGNGGMNPLQPLLGASNNNNNNPHGAESKQQYQQQVAPLQVSFGAQEMAYRSYNPATNNNVNQQQQQQQVQQFSGAQ